MIDYIADFQKYLPAYISRGNPADDTLKTYTTEITYFLNWCKLRQTSPLKMTELDARIYLRELTKRNYSRATISIKIAATKMFYFVAQKLKVVPMNPFDDIKTHSPAQDDSQFYYLSVEEIGELCNVIGEEEDLKIRFRNLSILYLMAVEGLRVVEVHRMNDEDIDLESDVIYIRGKGHDGYIYPCEDTMLLLHHYLKLRGKSEKDGNLTPTFTNFNNQRMSRDGLRWIVNQILIKAGKKKKGAACHMLRHSCGTNLYKDTKDLRLVQETLRQKNPSVTARYAHVVERMAERKTANISPLKGAI